MTIEYKRVARARKKKTRMTIGIVIAALIGLFVAAWFICTVQKVEVVGNENYSAKEIENLVLTSSLDYNTIYLWYQNKYKTIETPPFLDMVEIEIVSCNSIRIHAYEKSIMGYVEYLGNYVYFDKDGTVLETSNKLREGLPVVKGLGFDKMVLYEKLPVKDQEVFGTLVTLTQMLAKNELIPDCIEFTVDGQIDMTFAEVLVRLGKDEHMDNKIARLTGILPQLEGRSGILYMEDVDETTQRISFKKTKSKLQLEEEQRLREEEEALEEQSEAWEEKSDEAGEEYMWEDSSDDTGSQWGEEEFTEDGNSEEDWSESEEDWSESEEDWSESEEDESQEDTLGTEWE